MFVLGVAPTRRDTKDFELCYAHERKAAVLEAIRKFAREQGDIRVVDIDFLNEEGLMIDPEDTDRVYRHFLEQGVDAVIAPHCNFGAEEPVARLGRLMGKPFLLWGPRDEAPPASGPRQTDTQCGLFASGMMLNRYNVRYTYLENCRLDSPVFYEGLDHFIRVANVVKAFLGLRIAQISLRPRTFLSVKVNENQLLEKFGIDIVTVDYTEITSEIRRVLEEEADAVKERAGGIRSRYDASSMQEETLHNMAAMELGIRHLADKYGCSCVASECWRTFSVPFGIMPCAGFGDLIQEGLPVACEGDIHGVISSVLLSAAAMGRKPHFLADITIRHPKNDNAELLWHCGPFPSSLAKKGVRPVLNSCLGQFELESGALTLCRFGDDHGRYRLFADEAVTTDGPPTNGNYVWIETKDWPAWERKLVTGPYIHHISGIHGRYASVLRDACGYLGIEADRAEC